MSESNDPFADHPYRRPADDADASPPPPPPPAHGDEPTEDFGSPIPEEPASGEPSGADASETAAADAQASGAHGSDAHGVYRYDDSVGETTQVIPPTGGGGHGRPPSGGDGRPRRVGIAIVIAALVLGLIGGIGGAAAFRGVAGGDSSGSKISSLDDSAEVKELPPGAFEKVAKAVMPSVVQINVSGQSGKGSGSGIIISSDGQILTNNHVVSVAKDSGTINVAFNDGTFTSARVLGTDPVTDLAVIKAEDESDLKPAKFGNSSDLTVGQQVVAIGSPFGLESTVTTGIVSALNRPVSSADESGKNSTIFPAVQTDAAINPGNSGGPLVDLDGQVIAINSAIRSSTSQSSGEAGSIGLGFAIPVDLAKHVSEHLAEGKQVPHAQIGITVGSEVKKDRLTTAGAEVREVSSGSAGDKAGLEVGDIITAVDGNPISSSDALVATIRSYQPGDTIKITLTRDDDQKTVDVKLGSDLDKDNPGSGSDGSEDWPEDE